MARGPSAPETALRAAAACQTALHELAHGLAPLLAVPASARDGAAIADAWQAIERHRPGLSRRYRTLRKLSLRRRANGGTDRLPPALQRALARQTEALRQRLNLWHPIADLVARHAAPSAVALLPGRPGTEGDPLLDMVYKALHRLANASAQSEHAEAHGCFADIPMPIRQFETLMRAAYRIALAQGRTGALRFLDVGCGGGTKMFAASRFFAQCDGLEYDPGYAAAARRTLRTIGAVRCRVLEGDALTFDGYGGYDVIYFYRPMTDDALLDRMERRIFGQVPPGTILVAPYNPFLVSRRGMDCARVVDPIFAPGLSQRAADGLRADAERTGWDIVRRSGDFGFDPGFWGPILEVASFDTHAPHDMVRRAPHAGVSGAVSGSEPRA